MPFAFNQIQPTTIGTVDKWDIPLNRWLGVKFGSGYGDGLGSAVSNFTEDQIYDEGPVMKPDFATKTFGIPGHLKWDEPVSVGRASLLKRRKEAELENMAYLDSASHGSFSAKAFAGFGASMVGGFTHPLDLGTAFIPFVGSSTRALEAARLGAGPLERGLARGLITEEGIAAARIPFPRLSASMIEGVLSQAAVEIPIGIEKYRSQADYGIEDAATNILAGGAFAGGLHLAAKALRGIWTKTAEFHNRLTPETKDALAKEFESALMEGREPDTAKIISVDRNAIGEQVRFNEGRARAEAERIVIRDPKDPQALNANEILVLARDNAEEVGPGKILTQLVKRYEGGERTPQVLEQMAALLDRVYVPDKKAPFDESYRVQQNALTKPAREEIYQTEQVLKDLADRLKTAQEPMAQQLRINMHNLQLRRNELVAQLEKAALSAPLSPQEVAAHTTAIEADPVMGRKIDEIRNQRITEIVAFKKAEHEATMDGRVSQEVEAERASQIAEGRILSPEEVQERQQKPTPDDADIAVIEQDAKTLEKDILNRVADPEEQAALKAELAQLQEKIYTDQGAAVRAAFPCVGKE